MNTNDSEELLQNAGVSSTPEHEKGVGFGSAFARPLRNQQKPGPQSEKKAPLTPAWEGN